MAILPDAETFRRLVDGSSRGVLPAVGRLALGGLAVPYGLAVAARNAAYDRGCLRTVAAAVPVVSVGNLTLGGTGKTPLVAWIAARLVAAGRRPAIVSRGYAARPGETSDEAAELAVLLPGVMHEADRDRPAAAARGVARGADVVVLDDGFQHRRLRRDLDIVAIDASDPFGCDRLFPRGLLREPIGGLARAGGFVLTRADAVDAARRRQIRATVEGIRAAPWAEAVHRPARLRLFSGPTRPLDDLHGRRLFAFAGIGNPAAFRRTLGTLATSIGGCRWFADHHAYAESDLEEVAAAARAAGCDLLVTTLKDLVKIGRDDVAGTPLVALEIAVQMTCGGDALGAAIDRAVEVAR
ncbi:MAG: tetraacyldisaccharide 4'-kinase [Planctomycetia bacterium]|jgi:tetraacyldisaccharide 4'-kinase